MCTNFPEWTTWTKKSVSKIVLQIINDGLGKCHGWIGQSFAQKLSIERQWITICLVSRNMLKLFE